MSRKLPIKSINQLILNVYITLVNFSTSTLLWCHLLHLINQFFSLPVSSFSPGPVSSILVNRFGSRPIMIVGGCLSGSGLVAASFCNTVEQLYFFIGVVGGRYLTHFQLKRTTHTVKCLNVKFNRSCSSYVCSTCSFIRILFVKKLLKLITTFC